MRLNLKRNARIVSILAIVVTMSATFQRESRAQTSDSTFGNRAYYPNASYIAEKVTLVDGYGVEWNNLLHVALYYDGHYVYGDFNQDGLQDAAVIISESQCGTCDEKMLAYLINDGTTLVSKLADKKIAQVPIMLSRVIGNTL